MRRGEGGSSCLVDVEEVFTFSSLRRWASILHTCTYTGLNTSHSCLRGQASVWFQANLTTEDRNWMRRSGRDLERWELRLSERFAMTVSQAWAKLNAQSYGPYDARYPDDNAHRRSEHDRQNTLTYRPESGRDYGDRGNDRNPPGVEQGAIVAMPTGQDSQTPTLVSFTPDVHASRCAHCDAHFKTCKELHKHLHSCASHPAPPVRLPRLIDSVATTDYSVLGGLFVSRFSLPVRLQPHRDNHAMGLDTGASVSMIDETFLRHRLPEVKPLKLKPPFRLPGVSPTVETCTEYVRIRIWIPGFQSN